MARVSGGATISSATLARHALVPDRRLPHHVTALGDSRIAAIHFDPDQRVLGNRSPLNWANAQLGQRLHLATTFGVSGDRTDQMAARIGQAIAGGAGLLYLQGGLNDIAQGYPDAGTSGAVAAANLIAMAGAAASAGMTVVIEAEVGSGQLAGPQVAQLVDLNARLTAYALATPGIHLHDARPVVLDPAAADAALTYRDGFSYDGVHPGGQGALAWGTSLAALLDRIVPPTPSPLVVNRYELPGNGRRQLLGNPMFLQTTGGSGGSSGPVPAGYVVEELGGHVSLSTRVDPDGSGNNAVLSCSFAKAGDQVVFKQDALVTDYVAGDVVEACAMVDLLAPPTNLSALYLHLNRWDGTEGVSCMDLYGVDPVGPDQPMTLTLRTPPLVVAPGVGWLTAIVALTGGGVGAAQIAVRQMAIRRLG